MISIIDARAQNNLGMYPDAVGCQPFQASQDVRCLSIAEHEGPEIVIGSMNGKIEGRQPQSEDPLPVGFRQRSEGNIIAVEKRCPIIIIFYIQALPASSRHLIDETKYTLVPASLYRERGKFKAQHIIGVLMDGYRSGFAVAHVQFDFDLFLRCEELIVYDVENIFAVDGDNAVSLLYAESCSGTLRIDVNDLNQSGNPFGGKHKINITGNLRSRLVGDLPEFSQHHDFVNAQNLFEVIDLFF